MRIKIAFFVTSFDVGGAERQYWYLIDRIDRNLFDVHVIQISHKSSRPNKHSRSNVNIKTFDMKNKIDVSLLFRIAKYIRQNNIDLIQSQLFMDNQIARAVGFLSRRPVITSVRGGPTLGRIRTRIEHGFQWLTRSVVVNSHWLKNTIVSDGVNPDKIYVIHNGIDPSKFQSFTDKNEIKEKYEISEADPVIGIVARLHPMKDHRTFFDVANIIIKNRFPNLAVIVAGDGELRGELTDYVEQLGIQKNVRFLGTVGNELAEILRILDVILLTSRWGESLPNALLEAMSAGVPIVATNIHGIPEVVDNGVNGYLANIGDSIYMAEKVLTLLTDETMRNKFIKNGYNKINKFTIPVMVNKYEQLYKETIGCSHVAQV